MTSFPAQIDNSITLPAVVDNQTPVRGETVNRLRNAIIAVERELGVKPSGPYSTVRGRLDQLETILTTDIIALAGDLGGTNEEPRVIGLQGRLLSSATPEINQTLTWDGVVWKPSYTSTQTAVSSMDVNFISGAQLSGSNTPSAIGGRTLDMSIFLPVLGDGRVREISFYADVEVAGDTGIDGYVQLYDVTHDILVTGTDFHFTNEDVEEVASPVLTVGSNDGDIRDDEITYYEIRLWKVSDTGADRVICHSARLTISYV